MKCSLERLFGSAVLLLHSAHFASAHYQFPIFIVNNTASEWWQYVRQTGLDYQDMHFDPVFDLFTEPQVCGRNATTTGHAAQTATVIAGTQIGFQVISYHGNTPGYEVPHPPDPNEDFLYHLGPAQAYLSKAPGAIEDYEGDGDWFKIGLKGSTNGKDWDATNLGQLNWTIPLTTPPGKYLARVEHFYIEKRYNQTQQYINCAQIEVVGPGGGTPGPMTKFPGAYAMDDPGLWLPTAMTEEDMKNFKGAGPAVWHG